MTYAIAAAGTGGHIYPALAVAEELVRRGIDRTEIAFIGGDRLEATVVPEAGYDLISVEMRGFRRSLSPDNLSLPFVVRRAAKSIARELDRRRARALLVMGGYITVPAVVGARRQDVPFILHEQNGRPGMANRLVARGAARVLVAFPEAATRMRRAEVVGNPLRRGLVELDRATRRRAARDRYAIVGDAMVLGVMGGSQGAASINEAITRYAASPDRPPIIHLVGPLHAAAMLERAATASIPWRIVGFENSMEDFYAATDLVVSRAGASTVSELAATGTPSILVPLEAVAQQNNASFLEDAGGAIVVKQDALSSLGDRIGEILDDPSALDGMSAAARRAGHPDAAASVADALMEIANG